MAHTSTGVRSPTARSGSGGGGVKSTSVVDIAGIDQSRVDVTNEQVRAQAFKEGHFQGELVYPEVATPGSQITIRGKVHYDLVIALEAPEIRVRLDGPMLDGPVYQNLGELSHCETVRFKFDIPAPQTVGQLTAFTLTVETRELGGNREWRQTDEEGPIRVKTVSSGEKVANQVRGYAPWMLAGAGGGYLLQSVRSPSAGALDRGRLGAAGAGAAIGVGAKEFGDRIANIQIGLDSTGGAMALMGLAAVGFTLAQLNDLV